MIVSPDTAGGKDEKWFDPENIQTLIKFSEKLDFGCTYNTSQLDSAC